MIFGWPFWADPKRPVINDEEAFLNFTQVTEGNFALFSCNDCGMHVEGSQRSPHYRQLCPTKDDYLQDKWVTA